MLVEDVLQVEYTYMPSHFTAAQAAQIKAQFEHLLAALTRDAAQLCSAALILSRSSTPRWQIVANRNATARCSATAGA